MEPSCPPCRRLEFQPAGFYAVVGALGYSNLGKKLADNFSEGVTAAGIAIAWISTFELSKILGVAPRTVTKFCSELETRPGPKNATLYDSVVAIPTVIYKGASARQTCIRDWTITEVACRPTKRRAPDTD